VPVASAGWWLRSILADRGSLSCRENLYETAGWWLHDGMVGDGAVPAGGLGDAGAAELLYLCMEVAGCPTVCQALLGAGRGIRGDAAV
jgi:hypothetical protein